MKKQFTLLQLFSIIDGRLGTTMDDVYEVLNHVCDDDLMTHHLPIASNYVKIKSPDWFVKGKNKLEEINAICPVKERTQEQFLWVIDYLKKHPQEFEVPQLKDEFETSDFISYMLDNSLLLRMGSKA